VVVLVWVFAVSGRRRGGQALVAAAAAAIVTAGPLLLVAPSAAWRMVVEDQAGRGALHIEPGRVLALVGATPDAAISRVLAAVLWAVIVAGIVLVWRTQPWARLWVWLLASETLLLLANGVMFRHYSAVLAPLVVLVLGAAVQVVLDATSTWSGTSRVVAVASTATVVLAIIAGQLVTVSDYGAGRRFPWAQVTPLVAGARCVTADSATPLILTGSMSTNIEQGCPVVVDFTGQLYETRGEPLVRRENQAWQRWALDYLSSGDRTILVRQVNDGFTAATLADLVDRPVLLEAKKLVVLGERR
jgi:hypothetical protein